MLSYYDYDPGHPWYYYLDGPALTLKQIRASVRSDYNGYLEADILAAARMDEPKRTQKLRILRERVRAELSRDISIYRKVLVDLRVYRRFNAVPTEPSCSAEIHQSAYLKYNHLYNDFAHLRLLDEHMSRQLEMF